jgi:hypothetical protein
VLAVLPEFVLFFFSFFLYRQMYGVSEAAVTAFIAQHGDEIIRFCGQHPDVESGRLTRGLAAYVEQHYRKVGPLFFPSYQAGSRQKAGCDGLPQSCGSGAGRFEIF